jgi:type 1 glutamine amidotransferase
MRTGTAFSLGALLLAGVLLSACNDDSGSGTGGGASTSGSFRMLVYTRTAGFRHESIANGIETIQALGADNHFTVDATEDPEAFNDDNLKKYDVVGFINTTGDVLDDTQQAAFERYVRGGGGFVGVHSAADGEYDWPFYGELVGAYFKNHPITVLYFQGNFNDLGVQPGNLIVEAAEHPAVAHLPSPWRVSDEFYSFRTNPRDRVRVLMSIDEGSYLQDPNTSHLPISPGFPGTIQSGSMGDHPMSWCHDNLGGRAWYTALGHSASLYSDPNFQAHLLNGILTAARRIDADC